MKRNIYMLSAALAMAGQLLADTSPVSAQSAVQLGNPEVLYLFTAPLQGAADSSDMELELLVTSSHTVWAANVISKSGKRKCQPFGNPPIFVICDPIPGEGDPILQLPILISLSVTPPSTERGETTLSVSSWPLEGGVSPAMSAVALTEFRLPALPPN